MFLMLPSLLPLLIHINFIRITYFDFIFGLSPKKLYVEYAQKKPKHVGWASGPRLNINI